MREITKLRSRLKNIPKNSFEFRMTVAEARLLDEEFSELEQQISQKKAEEIIHKKPEPKKSETKIIKILDGGKF